jgi:N6-adenosine-specific RNA methylase IME4
LPVEAAPAAVTQAAAAKLLNVSERTVRSAKAVVEHGAPELVAKADAGAIAVSVAAELSKLPVDAQREVLRSADPGALYRVIKDQKDALTAQKKVKRAEKVKALGARQRALPAKKYGVIYADPEWDHDTWSEAGKGRAAANHYPVSSTAVIKSRPVGEIAAADCVLFLWVTVPHLAQGLDVLAAWGFAYKSSCVWEKAYPGKQQGMGYWFRVNHEILLVGTRGNVPAPALGTQWGSVIKAPVGEHSEKPAAVYELIEAYFADLPKIELNARRARPGWDAWGLEAPEAAGEPAILRPGVLVKPSYGGGPFVILSACESGGVWSLTCDLATSCALRGNSYFNELTIADGVVSDPRGDTVEIVGFDEIAAETLAERARRGDGGRYRVFADYGRTSERGLQALKAAVESGLVVWRATGDSEASTIIRLSSGAFESPGRGTHYKAYPDGEAVDGLYLARRNGFVEVTGYWDGGVGFSGSAMPYHKVNSFLAKLAKWRPPAPAAPIEDDESVDVPAFLQRDSERCPDTVDWVDGADGRGEIA